MAQEYHEFAFPLQDTNGDTQHGLTKRQWYIGQALAGGLDNWLTAGKTTDEIVTACVTLADAAIAKDIAVS